MNKKVVTMVTSLAVGGALLLATGFANASQISGYDAYKSAIVNTKNLKSETANMKVSVSDNKANLVNLSSNVKLNSPSNAMSSSVTITKGTTSLTSSNYLQDGKSINKDSSSNEYLVRTNNSKNYNKIDKVQNPTVDKSMEVVVDTLIGNMKDNVTTTNNSDGTKNIAVTLSKNEVTPLFNALTQIALIKGTSTENTNDSNTDGLSVLRNTIPQLQSEINIKSVKSSGKISKENIITDQTATIVVEGKDNQGKNHDITFVINLNLTNVNSTTPDKVNLTGKQVKEMTSRY